MQFKPESELVFSYERGKHLPTTLTIKNVGSLQMVFKFKASTPHKLSIKPNLGMVKPGEELVVSVIVHRDIVENLQNQQIQILYGTSEYSNSNNFSLALENGSRKDQLNLTMMVEERQNRVRILQDEMGNYRVAPFRREASKKSSGKVMLLGAGVLGVLLGFFIPFSLFG